MIVGVGIDLCSVARMRRELDRSDDFAAAVFTPREIAAGRRSPHPARRFAACFAAKEAVVKALRGTEPAGMLWRDIEIGADAAVLHGRARAIAASRRIDHVRIDVTTTEAQALACAFATSSGPDGHPGV